MLYETQVGHITSVLALVTATYTACTAAFGAHRQSASVLSSAYRGVVATFVLIVLTAAALLTGLISHDFQAVYVAEYSSRAVSWFYNLGSLWAGQAGSLILWSSVLSGFSLTVLWQHRQGTNRVLLPWVITVLMTIEVFFLGLLNFAVDAWQRLPFTPADGNGLMPLLLHPAMMAHPPSLYIGYVGFAVPFAFAMAALITGRTGDEWITAIRRWVLLAWFFLGLGLLLGGNWAYNELGWGGYWAWDPVENAALMPWLTGTAFLHSILIQQRRGMLKVWNIVLIILTFTLTLIGTFLNRSGIVSSVHSFGGSSLGLPFVIAITLTLIVSLSLLYYRLPMLRATNRLDAILSRESAFLVNNLLLVAITFAVLWGTLYPITSQALSGSRAEIGAPYYNRVAGPLILILLLFMAAGPLLSWRKSSRDNLERNLSRPALGSAVVFVVAFVLEHNILASLSFAVCSLTLFAVGQEMHRGAQAKMRAGRNYLAALLHLVDSNHSRYGGYLVHAGLAVIAIGVIGTQFFQADVRATLKPGQSMAAGPYTLHYQSLSQEQSSLGPTWIAQVDVQQGSTNIGRMTPSQLLYVSQDTPMTNVAIRSTPLQDLYVTLTGHDGQIATLRVLVNPLTMWVWLGGLILLIGGGLAFSPSAYERRVQRESVTSSKRALPAIAGDHG